MNSSLPIAEPAEISVQRINVRSLSLLWAPAGLRPHQSLFPSPIRPVASPISGTLRILLCLTVLLVRTLYSSQAQCPTQLTTQAEVDAFPPGCVNLPNGLTIRGGTDITNLKSLSVIESINGALAINSTTKLRTLEGLNNLTTIDGSLVIKSTTELTSLEALSKLTRFDNLQIIDARSLTSLTGLENITNIPGEVRLVSNDQLNNLRGLNKLTRIQNLVLITNPALRNLEGLNNVTSIPGRLEITSNDSLSDITALSKITFIGLSLAITDNLRLSQCAIEPICRFLATNRERNIWGNAPGCNSEADVQADCSPLTISQQPASSSVVCAGAAVSTSVGVSGNARAYQWYKNNVSLGAAQQSPTLNLPNVQASDAGRYNVVVSNSVTSLTSTAFSLTVNANPPVSINPASTSICQGQTTMLTASGADAYQWRGPQGFTSSTNPVTVSNPGTYSVTGTTSTGCSASATASLTVNPLPSVSLAANGTLTCAQTSVTLTALPNGLATYTFTGPGLNQSSPTTTASATQPGIYSVVATTTSGCSASATTTVEQNRQLAAPSLHTASGQTSLTVPQYSGTVTLLIDGCSGTASWRGPAGSSGTGTTIVVPTTQTGRFVYQATCQLGTCQSEPVSATVTVQAEVLKILVSSYDCATRQLVLRTTGGNGQPIEYQIPSVTTGWESSSTFTLQEKHLGKNLKLRARQRSSSNGGWDEAEISFTPQACGSRLAAEGAEVPLQVKVLGNPIEGQSLEVEIRGVEGQRVSVELVDLKGRSLHQQRIEAASALERVKLEVGSLPSQFILQVSTASQRQVIKLLKP